MLIGAVLWMFHYLSCPMHFNETMALSLAARDVRSFLGEVSVCFPFPHVACHGGYLG